MRFSALQNIDLIIIQVYIVVIYIQAFGSMFSALCYLKYLLN